jgi:hypothetical protein
MFGPLVGKYQEHCKFALVSLEGLDLDMVQAEELFQLNSVDATGMRE